MKSKFKSVLFSIIPGGGQFYLGLNERGSIFLIAFFSMFFLSNFALGSSFESFNYRDLIFNLNMCIWIFSAVDAYIFTDNINKGIINLGDNLRKEEENKKLISILLCVLPGAGHYYLGFKEKAYMIFKVFFIVCLFASIIPIGIFKLLVPVVIVYSIIDIISNKNNLCNESDEVFQVLNKNNNFLNKVLGILLILVGILLLGNNLIDEFLNYELAIRIKQYVVTGIVSLFLILIGIKTLLIKDKDEQVEEKKEYEMDYEVEQGKEE